MSFLEFKGLTVRKGEKLLIDNFNFRIEGPFFLALLGDNGTGKSSLLKVVLGLEKQEKGSVIQGFKKTAYLSQFNDVAFDLNVKDVVVMGLYDGKSIFDNYSSEDYKTVCQMLTKVGLPDYEERKLWSLSGGEQQLVWLAQQLLRKPDLLILDEPTSHLDIRNKVKFFSLIEKEFRSGVSILCTTHDIYLLKSLSGRYIHLGERIDTGELSKQFLESLYEV